MADADPILETRQRVDAYLAQHGDDVHPRVQRCVAEALAIDSSRVTSSSQLIPDLGAESLDLLDLVFRLEQEFAIKIPQGGILLAVRDGIEDRFEDRGLLSETALARLRTLMPEVPRESLVPGLRPHQVPELFTPVTFARLVAWRITLPAGA
jgi:acyl carrier protein